MSAPAANARFVASSGCSCATSSARSRSSSRAFCSASPRMARASRTARLCACRTASAAVSGSIVSWRRASCDTPCDAGSTSASNAAPRAAFDGAFARVRSKARDIVSWSKGTRSDAWASSSQTSPPSPSPSPPSSPRRPSGDAGRPSPAIRARTGHLRVAAVFSATAKKMSFLSSRARSKKRSTRIISSSLAPRARLPPSKRILANPPLPLPRTSARLSPPPSPATSRPRPRRPARPRRPRPAPNRPR